MTIINILATCWEPSVTLLPSLDYFVLRCHQFGSFLSGGMGHPAAFRLFLVSCDGFLPECHGAFFQLLYPCCADVLVVLDVRSLAFRPLTGFHREHFFSRICAIAAVVTVSRLSMVCGISDSPSAVSLSRTDIDLSGTDITLAWWFSP